jgi:hypothetical protein
MLDSLRMFRKIMDVMAARIVSGDTDLQIDH